MCLTCDLTVPSVTKKPGGDLGIGLAGCKVAQHIPFPRRQPLASPVGEHGGVTPPAGLAVLDAEVPPVVTYVGGEIVGNRRHAGQVVACRAPHGLQALHQLGPFDCQSEPPLCISAQHAAVEFVDGTVDVAVGVDHGDGLTPTRAPERRHSSRYR